MSAHLISIHQLRMLRSIANGQPWDQLHGKTREALLARKLIYRTDNGTNVHLSEKGRTLVRPLLAEDPTGLVQAPTALCPSPSELPPGPSDGCVLVCCEEFEAALAASVLQRTSQGRAYVGGHEIHRYWFIRYCPWCGDEREKSEEGAP